MPSQKKTRCIDKRIHLGRWQTGRHNLYPGLNLSKFFETTIEASRSGPFPYFFDNPKPFTNDCIPLTRKWKDIGSDIVERSLAYFKELNFIKEKMVCNKKLCRMWNIRLKQRHSTTNGEGPFNIYPIELLEYAKQLELNPEPEFVGGYNWYLTGGSLSVIQHNDKNYIIRPYGEELNHLDITPVNKKGKQLSTSKTIRIDLSAAGAIHEICTKSFEDELLVVTRSKRNIGLLRQGTETIVNNFESKVPYVSCDFSCEDLHLATTNTEKQMRVYDLNTNQTLNKFDLEFVASFLGDNWSCVKRFQPKCYLYADRRNLRPIDTRTKVRGLHFNVADYGEICDLMSCIVPSQRFEHLVYVGTSHRLFALDLRKFSGIISEQNMILSWTHMMNLPPLMMKTTVIDDSEMILISSNLPGDSRAFLTEYGSEYKNLYLPVQVPSAIDALQVAKDNFVCLSPVSSVNRRVRLCQTGLDFLSSFNGKISIVSQNSICDVFKQNVSKENLDDVAEVCEKMKKWMEVVDEMEDSSSETKEFGATAVIYKKDMVRVLKSTRLARPNQLEEELEAAKPKQRPRWQRSIAELANYKDALVESIMEVWAFPNDDNEILQLPNTEPEPLDTKVQSWFEKSHFNIDNLELMEQDFEIQTHKTETVAQTPLTNETKDTSYIDFSGEFNIIQTSTQQTIPENPPVVKSVAKTKKRKHVMGF